MQEISQAPTTLEIPEFPKWVLEQQEEEEEDEKEADKKKKVLKRNKETKRKGKGKKKVVEEEILSEDLEDTEEDEELNDEVRQMEKNEDEEDEDTTTESAEKSEEEDDLDLTMEELVRKKYAAKTKEGPVLTQISPSKQQPRKDPSPSPSPTPSTGTTPPHSPSKEHTQKDNELEKEPTKEKSPTQEQPEAKTPPIQSETTNVSSNIVFEAQNLQVIHEDPLEEGEKTNAEAKSGEGGPEQSAIDAFALGASASDKQPTVVVTIIPKNKEDSVQLVLDELAAKKRELANTQKFFKPPSDAAKVVKETPKDVGGEAVKKGERPKEKEGTNEGTGEEDPSLKDAAETTKESTRANVEQLADMPKDAVVHSGASTPGASAPEKEEPAKTVELKTGATASKAA